MRELSDEARSKMSAGGKKGGAAKVKKGFAVNPKLAQKASAKGLKKRYGKT